MGKRKNEQQAEGGGGELHVPKTKRSPGDDSEAPGDDGLDATGDADAKATPDVGRTDDCGQTTASSTRSANGEAAAPGATRPESPQRVNLVDEAEEDAPGRHGSASDTETQTHRGTGDVGDGPECLREAAGAAMALPGDTGIVVPAEVPGAHREEEGEHGELGDTDENQEPPGARVVNTEESECGAASERAAGGETQENGTEQLRAIGTSDAESCGSPERLGVCAPAVGTKGGTARAESTGKTAGEAAAGREETGAGETPSPGAGLAPDLAVAAGGSPKVERDGEAAAVSAAGMDAQPLVCREGMAETVPAVTVTPAPTGTTEPPGVGTGTAEPTGTTEPPAMGTGTAEATGMGAGVAVGAETPGESRVAGEPLPPQSELLPQQPPPATDRHNLTEPAPPGRSHNQEPPHREDATDVICGLILELSNLNRLAMSTHRGLETLRRPKLRQSRRPVPPRAGRRWKET